MNPTIEYSLNQDSPDMQDVQDVMSFRIKLGSSSHQFRIKRQTHQPMLRFRMVFRLPHTARIELTIGPDYYLGIYLVQYRSVAFMMVKVDMPIIAMTRTKNG